VAPRAVLDEVVKRKTPSPRREWNPRTPIVQPVAQRYIHLGVDGDVREIGWVVVDSIHTAQGMVQWLPLVYLVMNLLVL
jgi:hypothetical protein